jgi:hypothetical protein
MPSPNYYRAQADLFFRMAMSCADRQRAATLEAHGRLFLNLASQTPDESPDLNALLRTFNEEQLGKWPRGNLVV